MIVIIMRVNYNNDSEKQWQKKCITQVIIQICQIRLIFSYI